MTDTEFDALLSDTTKRISGDISWSPDEDHSPTVEFRIDIESDAGWPIFVRGSYVREHVVTAWYDLNALQVATQGLQYVSLFDDTMDVWGDEDFRLLEPLLLC